MSSDKDGMSSSASEFAASFSMPPHDDASTDPSVDGMHPLVVNPGRLSILLSLARSAEGDGVEFVDLRRQTNLTDGNLASHARRLANGGLIDVSKSFRDGKPVTRYLLTPSGEAALHAHVRQVSNLAPRPSDGRPSSLNNPRRIHTLQPPARPSPIMAGQPDEEWVD
jgi:DNA-binding MarR family transcriptional regulator